MTDTTRRLRFGTGAGLTSDLRTLARAARRAEEVGYSTFALADHFSTTFGPLVAAREVTAATTTLRAAHLVLDHDFRHPAVVAKELASIDVLSDGRLEVGLGAGWMQAEYQQAGISFDPPATRVQRLEEYAVVLKALFADGAVTFDGDHYKVAGLDGLPKPVQRPRPPLLIGGGGPSLLAVAGRQADIVHLVPRVRGAGAQAWRECMAAGVSEKVMHVRDAAGPRFADIELAVQLLSVAITDDPAPALAALRQRLAHAAGAEIAASDAQLAASPLVAVGSLGEVCDRLLALRDTFGVSYFIAPVGEHPLALAPVIDRLAGT